MKSGEKTLTTGLLVALMIGAVAGARAESVPPSDCVLLGGASADQCYMMSEVLGEIIKSAPQAQTGAPGRPFVVEVHPERRSPVARDAVTGFMNFVGGGWYKDAGTIVSVPFPSVAQALRERVGLARARVTVTPLSFKSVGVMPGQAVVRFDDCEFESGGWTQSFAFLPMRQRLQRICGMYGGAPLSTGDEFNTPYYALAPGSMDQSPKVIASFACAYEVPR